MDLQQVKDTCLAHPGCSCKAPSQKDMKKFIDKRCPFRAEPVGCQLQEFPCVWEVGGMAGTTAAKPTTKRQKPPYEEPFGLYGSGGQSFFDK